MAEQIKHVDVRTPDRNYKINIGYNVLKTLAAESFIASSDRTVCVISERVYDLHKDYVDNFIKLLPDPALMQMIDTEANKSYRQAEEFFNTFQKHRLTRSSVVISIGGGVVGDFAGFLASVYMRGLGFVQVPTTLLAMVDSSIGGKVAVNLSAGKNMVGAFHQPLAVYSDLAFFSTLPEEERFNGLSEVVKHALIGDSRTLSILEKENPGSVFSEKVLPEIVFCSAGFKASVVSKDEKEKGLRAILNFGHTAGHAIESCCSYQGISHGQAVAAGMRIASLLSFETGLLSESEYINIVSLLDRYALGYGIPAISPDEVYEHMSYDKKNRGDTINFVLLKKIGEPLFNQTIDKKHIMKVLEYYFKDLNAGPER